MTKKPFFSLAFVLALCLFTASCGSYEAPEWSIYADEWHSFRGTAENLAVTDSATPRSASECSVDWCFEAESRPSGLIYAENCIITIVNDTLYKLDADDGSVILSVTPGAGTEYGSASPVYQSGIIYAAFDDGIIMAFDFNTLDMIWTYTNSLGGQALSPILFSDNFLCTGFWNGEQEDAQFVCVDLDGNELMTYTNPGGFYLSGAVYADGYIIVPSDNGQSQVSGASESLVLAFDTSSWELAGSFAIQGDGRASAVYLNGKIYIVSKPGFLYSVSFNGGTFSNIQNVPLNGECTAPPLVYGNYAFVGVSSGQVLMIDLNDMTTVSSVQTDGYPQAAMLLSDNYVEAQGCVYIYTACNILPGGISVIKANIFNEKMSSASLFNAEGHEQYCLSAVICDNHGAIYYSNDSGAIFRLSKTN